MSMLSVSTPVPQLAPAETVAAKFKVPIEPPSTPTCGAVPQMLPPSTESSSWTVRVPELSTTPSWVTVPVSPPGLENVSESALGTLSVPVESFRKVDVDDGRV